jgi:hypothetical protein
MKTIWTGIDEHGEIIWNANSWTSHAIRVSRAARPPVPSSDKGKIKSGVKYVRRNFLCGVLGREPDNLVDLNAELRRWVAEMANQRVHAPRMNRGSVSLR